VNPREPGCVVVIGWLPMYGGAVGVLCVISFNVMGTWRGI
jgi:hypothetical protein